MIKPHKVDEYSGWEIFEASPGSFTIRKSGQRVGPYGSLDEARRAIDAEETQNLSDPKPELA